MKEELCINIEEANTELKLVVHRRWESWVEYIDFYYKINTYDWEINIWEPKKCNKLCFVSFKNIESYNIMQHDFLALEDIQNNIRFSERFILDKNY